MRRIERLVVDTYAWVELFRGGVLAEKVRDALLAADEVYTPDIVLAELARKYWREGFDDSTIKSRLEVVERLSTVTPIDVETAALIPRAARELRENAKRLGLRSRPSLADAVVLAQALRLNAVVLTGDQHFRGLRWTLWLG